MSLSNNDDDATLKICKTLLNSLAKNIFPLLGCQILKLLFKSNCRRTILMSWINYTFFEKALSSISDRDNGVKKLYRIFFKYLPTQDITKKFLISGCLASDQKSYSKLQRFNKATPWPLLSNTRIIQKGNEKEWHHWLSLCE